LQVKVVPSADDWSLHPALILALMVPSSFQFGTQALRTVSKYQPAPHMQSVKASLPAAEVEPAGHAVSTAAVVPAAAKPRQY
jgi:hypothetical protein